MKELTEYILQFGNLNKQQIDLVERKATAIELQKDEYFSEAGKSLSRLVLFWKELSGAVITTTKAKRSRVALSVKIVWWPIMLI
jgi:hypothetical protein